MSNRIRFIGLLTVAVLGSAGVASGQAPIPGPRFVTPNFAATSGSLPQRTATGDFDGDGRLDVATVNQGPSSVFGPGVGVNLGSGTGRLGPAVVTDLGNGDGACELAVGDWNNDALDDLVVSTCTTGGAGPVVALVAIGGGHFRPSQTLAAGNVQLVAGDFNGDGRADFATSQRGTAQVRTYLGRGTGTFRAPLASTPDFDSFDLETADLNGDHRLDLIGASGGPVWSMLGRADGRFGPQQFHASEVVTGIELAVADLNGDAKPDVAVVDASGGHLGIGLGTGSGTFTDGQQVALGTLQATWVAAGRITNDARVDLVAGLDNDSTAVALLAGRGDGTVASATHWVTGAAGLVTGEFTGDGRDDLVSVVPTGRVYLSRASGAGFAAPRLAAGPNSADVADLNGDGIPDKITGSTDCCSHGIRSVVVAQLSRGDGTFGRQIVTPVRRERAGAGLDDIALADLDEDGVLDVVGGFSNFQAELSNTFWAFGTGTGSFTNVQLSTAGDRNADVAALAAADVNGDGHVDLVANDLSHLTVRLGAGDGTFGAPIASGAGSGANRAVLVADATGDGVPDVVTTVRTGNEDFGSGEIRLQRGHGDGRFTLVQSVGVDSNLASGAVGDLNGDGQPDFVTAGSRGFNGGENALWVLLTTPAGRLGAPVKYLGPTGQVALGDLDVDGDLDVATTGDARVDLYLNSGNGALPRITDVIAAGPLGTVADLTGDGAPEMISGSPFGEYAVHLNAG